MAHNQSDTNRGPPKCRLRLLASTAEFIITDSGEAGGGRRLALLAYLFLRSDPVSRDQLCELLWDPEPGRDSQHRLRELLSDTRRVLGADILITEGRLVTLDRTMIECDVLEFRRAVAEGRLADAAQIYEADFMMGYSPRGASLFREWADEYGRQLKREHTAVLTSLLKETQTSEDYDSAAHWAERLWTDDPDNKEYAILYVAMRSRTGSRREALTAAATVESHFIENDLEIPADLRELLTNAQTIRTPAFEKKSQSPAAPPDPQISDVDAITATPTDIPIRRYNLRASRYAIVGGTLALIALLVFAKKQSARSENGAVFGGGGTLIFRTSAGHTRALRFVGPNAGDTVGVTVEFSDSILSWQGRFSPSHAAFAFGCQSKSGDREVCVRSTLDGTPRTVTSEKGDDYAQGWSPDGSWLLVQSGRDSNKEDFNYEMYAVEPRSGRSIRISRDPLLSDAVWSPDGSRIAVIARGTQGTQVLLRTVDGIPLARYAFSGTTYIHWSPDGRRMLAVDRAEAHSKVYDIAPPRRPQHLPTPFKDTYYVAWSPNNSAIALTGFSSEGIKLVVCVVQTCDKNKLEILDASEVAWVPPQPHAFLQKIQITADSMRIQAGERLKLHLRNTDQRGNPYTPPYLRWRVIDSLSAWIDSAMVLHATRPGVVRVLATAGGWRADTLSIHVTSPRAELLFEETWEAGLDKSRWKSWGSPLPEVVMRGGNSAFKNNGDDNYPSGVATRRRFNLADGITLEWRQKTPITGLYWQEVWIDFKDAPADSFRAGDGDPFPIRDTRISVRAPIPVLHATNPMLGASCETSGDWDGKYPQRLRDAKWHDFVFQLHLDGRCELIVDGELLVSHSTPRFVDSKKTYTMSIGGRTYKTDILVDDIRLWRGIRWTVSEAGRGMRLTE